LDDTGAAAAWSSRANALTLLRLLAAPGLVLAILSGQARVAALLVALAVVTDLADGPVARRFGGATRLGGLLDHAVDAIFVTAGSAALAWLGMLPAALPPLIALAFVQYALDSKLVGAGPLRASFLGRWNGVAYYAAVALPIARDALDLEWPAAQAVYGMGWLLVASTLVSIADRLRVLRAARQSSALRGVALHVYEEAPADPVAADQELVVDRGPIPQVHPQLPADSLPGQVQRDLVAKLRPQRLTHADDVDDDARETRGFAALVDHAEVDSAAHVVLHARGRVLDFQLHCVQGGGARARVDAGQEIQPRLLDAHDFGGADDPREARAPRRRHCAAARQQQARHEQQAQRAPRAGGRSTGAPVRRYRGREADPHRDSVPLSLEGRCRRRAPL
jgi:phosphatidylglycerophosphate synthase